MVRSRFLSVTLSEVHLKAIQYLAADFQPSASQTPEGITQLVKDLAPYGLTKAEKLQVVNLAPTEPVELYVVRITVHITDENKINGRVSKIVEELEDRFPDQMESILVRVRASLGPRPSQAVELTRVEPVVFPAKDGREALWGADEGMVVDENVFDDAGQGVGVEGDLEGEED